MNIIKRYIDKLMKNKFIKNMIVLVGGTVFAQGIIVLSSPILTRMYTPDDFGILAIYISVISILNSMTSMKYELALPLTKNKKETVNLFAFNIILASIISFIVLLILLLFGDHIFKLLSVDIYIDLLRWLIPLTLLFMGVTTNFTYLFVKIAQFKNIANIKVNSTFAKVLSQLSLGVIPSFGFGLIAGDVFSRFLGAILGIYLVLKEGLYKVFTILKKHISFENMKAVAVYYKKFPLYSMPAGLINSFSTHITPIILIFSYGPAIAGFYSLTQRVLGLPISLVGQSISQVYLSQAPSLLEKDINLVRKLYIKVTKNLLLLGGVPILLLAIFGESIFVVAFGEKWANSGIYLKALGLMFIAQITVVPLSQTLNIVNKQNVQLIWDISRVFISLIAIIYPAKVLLLNPEVTLLIYSISMFLLYLVLYFISLYYLSEKRV